MQMAISSILSNLPGLMLLFLTVRQGRKEGIRLKTFVSLIIMGCFLMLPVVALQIVIEGIGQFPFIMEHPLLGEIIQIVIRLAFVEELCKFWATKIITWKSGSFTCPSQGMLFPAVTGLAFGIFENVLYMGLSFLQFQENFWFIVLTRAFVGAPAHGAYGVVMGIFYGKAKYSEQQKEKARCRGLLCLSVLVPGLIHGMYDWLMASQIVKLREEWALAVLAADAAVVLWAYIALYCRKKGAPQVEEPKKNEG